MAFGFALQVEECLNKYFSKKTTMANIMSMQRYHQLPTLTFCPGFKAEHYKPARHVNSEHIIVTYFDVFPSKGDFE